MISYEQSKAFWLDRVSKIKPKKEFDKFVFIIMLPEKFEWNFSIQKQLQTTLLQTSGGFTGAGTGYNQKICYLKELPATLDECDQYSHAMIVSVGMIFDVVNSTTSIQHFFNWAKTDAYCRGHIIAKPGKPAYLHHQHVELNLDKWREKGKPNVFGKMKEFKRSSDNHHDDYTPFWIKPTSGEIIENFSAAQRELKAWSYSHMAERKVLQKEAWDLISTDPNWKTKVSQADNYFRLLLTRCDDVFYTENTEALGKLPKEKFDLIITPAAGYSGEVFAEELDFDGEVVFYDYCKENVDIKQMTVEMNMSFDELIIYARTSRHLMVFNNATSNKGHKELLTERASTFGKRERLQVLQEKMYDNYDVSYKHWNVISGINDDHSWFIEAITGKDVFMDVSNIYGYHISHMVYTVPYMNRSFDNLIRLLTTYSKSYYIKGTTLTKEKYENNCS